MDGVDHQGRPRPRRPERPSGRGLGAGARRRGSRRGHAEQRHRAPASGTQGPGRALRDGFGARLSGRQLRGRASVVRRLASRRPLPTWMRWLVLVIQLAVGLLPLQSVGVLHVMADMATVLVGESIHQGEPPCSYEQQGERCPPDCSHCHCPPALPALPVAWPVLLPPQVRTLRLVQSPYDATAPPRPMLLGLERPPRHDLFA